MFSHSTTSIIINIRKGRQGGVEIAACQVTNQNHAGKGMYKYYYYSIASLEEQPKNVEKSRFFADFKKTRLPGIFVKQPP